MGLESETYLRLFYFKFLCNVGEVVAEVAENKNAYKYSVVAVHHKLSRTL